ncbi:hypothetical protein LHP98_11760 [Rhodobacter sp. Har01]|uniref:hypothetical protein n=1 Tax=Rhodobacter sp. Har01 TaxID=2883999 RepID=UPI001D08FB3A|nr:hypothetical protein [Rhodobacter sp. Har01]MCB6178802.1 hypothetical protein [Rhodobacter sp. Har01]
MPQLIRLYIQSVAIGFALAAVFAGVMVWQDVMGVGRLILGSDMGLVALAMLVVFNGIIFAGVQFGLRVMLMAEDDSGPKGGLRQHAIPAPVRVAAPAPKAGQRRR